MIALLRRNCWKLVFVALLGAGIIWWLMPDPIPEVTPAKVMPDAGSPGTILGPILSEAGPLKVQSAGPTSSTQTRVVDPNAPTEEELRLWPHLAEKAPTLEERSRVNAQWQQFAQLYPENIFLPLSMQPKPTPEQLQVMRRRRDNADEIEAYQAAQKASVRNAPNDQTSLSSETPRPADPQAFQDFLHVKIQELESKVQLANFALANGQLSSDRQVVITKELQKWNLDLEEFRRLKESTPSR
jgi:hypothetical protein